MGDKVREGSEEMQEEISDLMKKIHDLSLQQQEVDDDVSSFINTSDKVLAVQEMREKELKGYVV
jgi:hypothetical protein